MICRHYLQFFFSVRHAIIRNLQSTRAVIPLLAGYRLCVTAEVVTMMIPLHTKTGEFKKKRKKKKLLLQFQRRVCCEVVMRVPPGVFRAAEQTTKPGCFALGGRDSLCCRANASSLLTGSNEGQ